MLKILTACSAEHEQYLQSCKDSVASLKWQHEHLVSIGDSPKHVHMNRLLKEVNNDDIVLMLDADDLIIGDINESLRAIKHSDLVYRDVLNENEDGSLETYHSQPFDMEVFRHINFIPYSGTMLKGWLAKKADYPDLFHGNDWNYWWALLQYSDKFYHLKGTFVKRRAWTSYKRCDIPVYRKLRRLYYQRQVKKQNEIIYKSIKKNQQGR